MTNPTPTEVDAAGQPVLRGVADPGDVPPAAKVETFDPPTTPEETP